MDEIKKTEEKNNHSGGKKNKDYLHQMVFYTIHMEAEELSSCDIFKVTTLWLIATR